MKKLFAISVFSFFIFAFFSVAAYAQVAAPEQDVGQLLLNLVTNYKTLGPIGISMILVNLIIGLLKSDTFGNFFKKIDPLLKGFILVVLGQASGVLVQLSSGKSVASSIVFGLITSGGAVAIYEAYNLFKKQAAK